jgi:hypothetical protein
LVYRHAALIRATHSINVVFLTITKVASPLLAHCRRNVVLQQVGSYLGYTGRGANALGKAARDPFATSAALWNLDTILLFKPLPNGLLEA